MPKAKAITVGVGLGGGYVVRAINADGSISNLGSFDTSEGAISHAKAEAKHRGGKVIVGSGVRRR